MSFAQGAPTQPLNLIASNVFVTGTSAAGNAFTVQQLGVGNVASFQTSSGSTALLVNSAGQVGIGKTNPSYAMDITGDLNFTGTFRQNGTPYIGSQWTGTSTLYFVGNVGINTTSVANPLTVGGTVVATTLNLTNALGTAYGGTGITSFTSGGLLYASTTSALASSGAYTAGQVLYGGGAGAAPGSSSGLFWDSTNSRLGIGTNNPSKLLHVWGGLIIGASSDSRATIVTLNAPGATATFSPNSDIGDGARIMCLQCPDLSSTTANLVSFSLQVAPTGTFGSQRTSLDLKGFRVASQSYGGFCITSPFDSAGSYDLFYADRTKAYFQQNVGIGTASPTAQLHVYQSNPTGYQLSVNNVANAGGTNYSAFIHSDQAYCGGVGGVGQYTYSGASLLVTSYPNNTSNNSGYTAYFGTSANDATSLAPQMVIKAATGNVGIGTTNPLYPLQCTGDILTGGGIRWNTGGVNPADKKLYSSADGDLEWVTNNAAGAHGFAVSNQGTKVVYLNTTGNSYLNGGNVGIGTASPSSTLDIRGGNISFGSYDTTSAVRYVGIYNVNDGGGCLAGMEIENTTLAGNYSQKLHFRTHWYGTNNGRRLTISEAGNVGIGTTSPGYPLDVSGDMHCSGAFYCGNNSSATAVGSIGGRMYFGGTYGDQNYSDGGQILSRLYATSESSELVIFKGNDVAGASGPDRIRLRAGLICFDTYPAANSDPGAENIRMTIDGSGNVGIGTTSPSYKLHVSGGDSSYSYFGPNTTWGTYLKVGTGTSYASTGVASINCSNGNLHIDAASTSTYNIYLNYFNSGGNGANYGQVNSYGTFYNNGAGLFTGDVTAFYSDERLKTKTGKIENALDKVCSLDTFTYVPNELAKSIGYTDEKERLGLSAQQVQKVAPQVVCPAPIDIHESGPDKGKSKSGEDYLTVQYDKLIPLLVEALKEERSERLKVEERLARLEKLLLKE